MTMTVMSRAEANYLVVMADGEFDLDEAMRTFREVVVAVIANRSEKVLFDGRRISGDPESIERFFYGEFAARTVRQALEENALAIPPQFAYILCPPVLDPERLGETAASNRGMNVKAFDELADGISWLGLPPGDVVAFPDFIT
ncbi:MAG: hypothetical protein ACJ73D_07685 [Pyrinomonadaceae bacterium]